MARSLPVSALLVALICFTQATISKGNTALLFDEFVAYVEPTKAIDLVLIVDRSSGIGEERFIIELRKLAGAVLRRYPVIHPEFTRLALITFGRDSRVIFDYISDTANLQTKCGVFGGDKPAPWDEVVYIRNDTAAKGTDLIASFRMADKITKAGKENRPNANSMILVITDGDYNDRQDPINEANALKAAGVIMFTCGIGNWLKPGQVRILATQEGYYGSKKNWTDMMAGTKLTSYSTDTVPLWLDDAAEVCNRSCGAHARCQCDVLRGVTECMCFKGYYLKDGICEACASGTYKSETGNHACEQCPHLTVTDSIATERLDQCKCPEGITCSADPCEQNPCGKNSVCRRTEANFRCECGQGWSGAECLTNEDDCVNNACLNGATCYDMLGDYACICASGFVGRYCEVDVDECASEGLCRNGGTCEDKVNNFHCICPVEWKGRFCKDVNEDVTVKTTKAQTVSSTTTAATVTNATTADPTGHDIPVTIKTSTTTPSTATAGSTTVGAISSDSNKLDSTVLIIIICACVGVVLLLVFIAIIVATRRRHRRNKDPELEKTVAGSEQQTNGTISRKFSGFWKKKTVRGSPGSLWLDEDTNTMGRPSVPATKQREMNKSGHEDGEAVNMVEEAMFCNTQIVDVSATGLSMMDGWNKYLQELVESGTVERAVIIRPDGTSQAKTDSWLVDLREIDNIWLLLKEREVDVPVAVQDGEYHVRYNDGTSAGGRSFDSGYSATVLAFTRTKNYVLAAIAEAESDNGECRKELDWIGDHIRNEGY